MKKWNTTSDNTLEEAATQFGLDEAATERVKQHRDAASATSDWFRSQIQEALSEMLTDKVTVMQSLRDNPKYVGLAAVLLTMIEEVISSAVQESLDEGVDSKEVDSYKMLAVSVIVKRLVECADDIKEM